MFLARLLRSRPRSKSVPARTRLPARRLAVEPLEDRCTPSSGGLLDPTFGTDGMVITDFSGPRISVTGAPSAVQPDGKVVVAGASYSTTSLSSGKVHLVRYNPDGTRDATFDADGIVTTKYRGRPGAAGVVIDPTNGKIVVMHGDADGVHLVRYNPNGSIDRTFNGGRGTTLVTFPGYGSFGGGLLLQSANNTPKLLVYGSIDTTPANTVFALTRYNLDGTVDTGFGSGGAVVADASPGVDGDDLIRSAVVQPDGKIVVTGFTAPGGGYARRLVVARFTPAGALDPGFGTDPNTGAPGGGLVVWRLGVFAEGRAVALQAGGRIVVGGRVQPEPTSSSTDAVLARLNPDGTADTTFPGGGYFYADLTPGFNDSFDGVAVQSDGAIVVGTATEGKGGNLVRYAADGSPDATFGTGGRVPSMLGAGVRLLPDGKILVTGAANGGLGAARYLASAPQVGSFAAAPNPVASGGSLTLTASGITDANPGATVTRVEFYYFDAAGVKQLLGTGTQTSPGVWELTFTVNLTAGSYTLYAQATDNFGAVGDPTSLTLDVL